MSGWSADSDAAAMLSNLGIGEEHHFTLMADLEAKIKVRVPQALLKPDLLIMDEPTMIWILRLLNG
jgi:ATPase subunit of ABC transporter with duplicated ATPase domains